LAKDIRAFVAKIIRAFVAKLFVVRLFLGIIVIKGVSFAGRFGVGAWASFTPS